MPRLTPGVTLDGGNIVTAHQAAAKAVELSEQAAEAGTFGVGGFLMDRSGRILAQAINAVIRDGEVYDPTAHVERQLIDWYFEARANGLRSEPADLIIVSSLDPCAMCTGAILLSGMQVVALAEDPLSGVHYDGSPHRLPIELWPTAESSMGLFKAEGRGGRANHISSIFADQVSRELVCASERSFQRSLELTRNRIAGTASGQPEVSHAVDSATLAGLHKLMAQLPDTAWMPQNPINVWSPRSSRQIAALLSGDASALVDERGTVIVGARRRADLSPARSSVLELIRAYIELGKAAKKPGLSLPHQRTCSLIKLKAPSDPATAVLEFGALGSFFEQAHIGTQLPAFGFIEADRDCTAKRFLASLAPLYTSIIRLDVDQIAALPADAAAS